MSIPTNGEVKIVIQFGEGENTSDGNAPSPSSPQQEGTPAKNPTDGKDKKDGLAKAAAMAAFDTVKTLGTQAITSGISQIGLTSGNYYAQAQAQRSWSAAQTVVGLASTASTSPLVAVVSIASMAISAHNEMKEQNKTREIENYQATQYAKRLGYTVARRG